MTTLTIDLPDTLIKEAQNAGLLKSGALQKILREAMQRKAVDELFETADQLTDANFPAMTLEEIQVEVNTVRTERKRRASGT
jgi:hypothetical protein